jgi:hypothetical protein
VRNFVSRKLRTRSESPPHALDHVGAEFKDQQLDGCERLGAAGDHEWFCALRVDLDCERAGHVAHHIVERHGVDLDDGTPLFVQPTGISAGANAMIAQIFSSEPGRIRRDSAKAGGDCTRRTGQAIY